MLFDDIDDLRIQMNRAACDGQPFLFAVDYELNEGVFIRDPDFQTDILYRFAHASNAEAVAASEDPSTILDYRRLSKETYAAKFDIVRRALLRGDAYLANLTVRTPVSGIDSLRQAFTCAVAPYCLYVPDRFVCFSPERFVRIDADGSIFANPMKGTADADEPDAARKLLDDEKETFEHNTVVDLLRNDLGIHARNVSITRFRYIEAVLAGERRLLQASTEIRGRLGRDWRRHLGDALFSMLPAGSCSGAPKESVLGVIREAEKEPRGYYTGVFGLFDGCRFDSAVMIRYIEERDGSFYFRSGGGITALSEIDAEYDEIYRKIYIPTP